jgi:hypothetical protein
VISFIGGTGLNTVKEPSKGGGKIMRESLQRFAKVSLDAGADAVIASHPFLDDSWEKASLVNEGKAGAASPWVSGTGPVLRYYAATIEAVQAIEAHDRLKLSQSEPATAQSKLDLAAFAGRWLMNAEKTRMGRMGPTGKNTVRSKTFTWVFTPESEGLRMDVYTEYPQPAPTRTLTVIPDGKRRGCDSTNKSACLTRGGEAEEQSYVYYQMDPHMVARVFYIKDKVYEYSTYSVSTDGKTFTSISWDPTTPEYQNIQVFEKQP